MTTVRFLSRPASPRANSAGVVLLVLLALGVASSLVAQEPPQHWLHNGVMPPGAIGAQRMLRSGPLSVYSRPQGYVQPVEVLAGDRLTGTELEQPAPTISIASGGGWTTGHYGRVLVGLEVGRPYRLRVSGIKLYEETAVYPTIELIDRLHPPPGKMLKFPVPVELTTEELQIAARGGFVTRVIYVEDPAQALPIEQKFGQPYVEVRADDDPLIVADRVGRPIAILRIGARGPGSGGLGPQFTFGDPAVQVYDQAVYETSATAR